MSGWQAANGAASRRADLIMIASEDGYRSLGWADGGRIADGAPADFVVVRSDSVRTTGARPDQIAYAASGADVDQVVVAGQPIVRDGQHQLGSPARLLESALDQLGTHDEHLDHRNR